VSTLKVERNFNKREPERVNGYEPDFRWRELLLEGIYSGEPAINGFSRPKRFMSKALDHG
jgi:hypothetical protein